MLPTFCGPVLCRENRGVVGRADGTVTCLWNKEETESDGMSHWSSLVSVSLILGASHCQRTHVNQDTCLWARESACPRWNPPERFSSVQFQTNPVSPARLAPMATEPAPQRARLAVCNAFLPLFRSLAHYISFENLQSQTNQSQRARKNIEGMDVGLVYPRFEALLCGNKSCCWLDKLCRGVHAMWCRGFKPFTRGAS